MLAVGCGGGDDDSSKAPDGFELASTEQLTGKTFNSTEVKGEELVPGTTITISFGPGALTVSAGCNSIRGAYEITDGVLTLGKAAGTLVGCPGDRQKQDEWLTELLTNGVRPYLNDDDLQLLGLGVEIEMKEGTAPGAVPPVIGTTWELSSYGDNSGSTASVKPGVRLPFLQFAENDTVKLFDGCNTGSGPAQVNEDGSIVFGPLALTRKACPGLTGDVSRAILNVLKGKTAYAFEGQNLVISRKGSSLTYNPG